MTNRQIDNRIKKLQELERQKKDIEQKENELKAEIKRDLESKALKTAFPELCEQFTKPTKSKRFTIA